MFKISLPERLFITIIFSLFVFFLTNAAKFQTATDCIEFARKFIITADGRIHTAFFVPDDRVKTIMLGLIHNEKTSIRTAQFRIIDKDIAEALIAAHKRNVLVHVVTDHSCILDQHEKVSWLSQAGIQVKRYVNGSAIMHNKFWIFENNFLNRKILVTGSANATRSGLTRNEENILVLDDTKMVDRYNNKFIDLWRKTITYTSLDPYISYNDAKHHVKQILRLLRVIF